MTRELSSAQHLALSKSETPILLLEGIAETAVEALHADGYTNITRLMDAISSDN